MDIQLYKITNYEDGEMYYFCQEACAESFDPWGGDWSEPEEITDKDLADEDLTDPICEFCKQKLKRD